MQSIYSHLSLSFLCLCCGSLAVAAETKGISDQKPASGRFVQVDSGYMVPYRQQIPGADAVFEMIPIPGGEIRLTSEDGAEAIVKLQPYWMGRYEVTWGEFDAYYEVRSAFQRFERMKIRQITAENQLDAVTAPSVLYDVRTRYPFDDEKLRATYPAVSMTQYAAKQYTKWLSKLTSDFYRLPSEAEWEHACRAGSAHAFSYGDDPQQLDDYAWYEANADDEPHPVGRKKPNAWGLYDMHGNACEWVLDQYSDSYTSLAKAIRGIPANEPSVFWPTQIHPRSVRGGSWASSPNACRSAARRGSTIEWQDFDPNLPQSPFWLACDCQTEFGFRVMRPLNAPKTKLQNKYWDADCEPVRDAVQEYTTNRHALRGIVDPQLPRAIEGLEAQRLKTP